LLLARAGHRVTLFERFTEAQPVGSGLLMQPTGLAVLRELGLAADLCALGARIDRLRGRTQPAGRLVLDVRYAAMGPGRHGLAVHRAALFEMLLQAVTKAGIAVETGAAITALDRGGQRPGLIDARGRRHGRFDLVVNAMGIRSPLSTQTLRPARVHALGYGALWASLPWPADGFDPHALEQRYLGASVMAGVLPIGRTALNGPLQAAFFWSLKAADYAGFKARGLEAWKSDVLCLWPQTAGLLAGIDSLAQLTFARYQHHTMAEPFGDRIAHIGDAAHATSPQLGQGANMALLDALALSIALDRCADLAAALRGYARLRRWHVRIFQGASRVFTPFYQSDSRTLPFIRDRLAAPVSRLPVLDRLLAKLVAGLIVPPLGSAPFAPYLRLAPAADRSGS